MGRALPKFRKPTASWERLGTVERERDDAKSGDAAENVDRNSEEFRSGKEARAKPKAAVESEQDAVGEACRVAHPALQLVQALCCWTGD